MDEELRQWLGPEYVTKSTGDGYETIRLTYAMAKLLADEILGKQGYSVSYKDHEVVHKKKTDSIYVTVRCVARITLSSNAHREDFGLGEGVHKDAAEAVREAIGRAQADAFKRSLRQFGNVLGNCLYDKNYIRLVGPQVD